MNPVLGEVKSAYSGDDGSSWSVNEGDTVTVTRDLNNGFCVVLVDGRKRMLPMSLIAFPDGKPSESPSLGNSAANLRSPNKDGISNDGTILLASDDAWEGFDDIVVDETPVSLEEKPSNRRLRQRRLTEDEVQVLKLGEEDSSSKSDSSSDNNIDSDGVYSDPSLNQSSAEKISQALSKPIKEKEGTGKIGEDIFAGLATEQLNLESKELDDLSISPLGSELGRDVHTIHCSVSESNTKILELERQNRALKVKLTEKEGKFEEIIARFRDEVSELRKPNTEGSSGKATSKNTVFNFDGSGVSLENEIKMLKERNKYLGNEVIKVKLESQRAIDLLEKKHKEEMSDLKLKTRQAIEILKKEGYHLRSLLQKGKESDDLIADQKPIDLFSQNVALKESINRFKQVFLKAKEDYTSLKQKNFNLIKENSSLRERVCAIEGFKPITSEKNTAAFENSAGAKVSADQAPLHGNISTDQTNYNVRDTSKVKGVLQTPSSGEIELLRF